MTKEVCDAIAEALRVAMPMTGVSYRTPKMAMWSGCVMQVAMALGEADPSFDRYRFYAVCDGRSVEEETK